MTNLKSTMIIQPSPPNSNVAERDKKFAKSIEFEARQIYPGCHNKTKGTKVFSILKSEEVFDYKGHMDSVQKKSQRFQGGYLDLRSWEENLQRIRPGGG